MRQETLSYRPAGADRLAHRSARAAATAAAVMAAANAALVGAVVVAPRLGPFVAIFGILALNASLLLVSLGWIPLARRYVGGGSLKPYLVVSVAAPVALWFCDVFVLGRLVFPNGVGH